MKNLSTKRNNTLAVVIVSFNTYDLLQDCINSLEKYSDVFCDVYIVDNGSTDGSIKYINKVSERKLKNIKVHPILLNENVGFAKGNNAARKFINYKYTLFLNPDTYLVEPVFKSSIEYIEANEKVGAMTCKVVLPNGSLDKDTRRSFPTPWVALSHFSFLDRIFPKSRLFAKYWYGYMDENEEHQIDVLQGAFCLMPTDLLNKIGWFDEDYFLDGEDIDLCWKVYESGFVIMYNPKEKIIHVKKGSKKKNKKLSSSIRGVNAMQLFYKKRLEKRYPAIVNFLVYMGINLIKLVRIVKYMLTP